jgi:acyl carrier protein
LDLGADIVMHSATKYFGGHSDCLAGALSAKTPELHRQLYFIQNATGGVIGGLEAFLLHRGIKTMELRVREQSKSALAIAQWLESHRSVARVLYPGLASHPHHQRAVRLMGDQFGGMVTFDVRGDIETAKRVCKATELFGLAVSCGAVESLIEQPATMSHASYDPAARAQAGICDTLVRISVGLEDPEDLIADLDRALGIAGGAWFQRGFPAIVLAVQIPINKALCEKDPQREGPMDNFEETQAQVIEYLSKLVGSRPHLDDSLAMIGIDSVAMAEMTFELEKRFAMKIDDEILDVESVRQLVQYLHQRKPA